MTEPDKAPPLERYIRILELLAGFPTGLSLTEVATLLALPKATAHRLLRTMQESQLVEPAGPGASQYVTGRRLRTLLYLNTGSDWVDAVVRPHLRALVDETHETAYIAKLEGTTVRSILMEAPDTPWRGFVLPGKEMHPHAAASAKAIIAFRDEATIARALAAPLEKLTTRTVVDPSQVRADYAVVRERGYATCIAEIDDGLAALGVPIMIPGAEVVFSLGLTGPIGRVLERDLDALAATMAVHAKRIAAGLVVGRSRHDLAREAG
ncbi:IclR family transcriptional regulator [Chitinasiproducens palmae]|uniref:DNA-binding transcriptional regulator, IclR family n=1 Tax=Chitinasiproducens palmae TaxID=1770053 RepID=A0A1H2PRH4_9BURK|nr:IclR family transcriptional regulator C-terminal domain-containing protein [Chitinasiproducens palmae]SDV49495.1 DNA-binding transcriptional regulator, IclR family [Chitinasiproducens palmae]